MFSSSRRLNILSSVLIVLAGGCGGGGLGCGTCSSEPLPGGALPIDQTVEGGGQIRVTPAGFTKISNLIESVVSDALEGGTCVPSGEIGNAGGILGTGAYYCYNNDGTCAPGCDVGVSIDSFTLTPAGDQLNLATQFDVAATVPLDYQIIGIGGSCDMTVAADNLTIDADIDLDIDAASGELGVHLGNINDITLNLDFGNCGLVSGLLDLIGDVLDFLEDFLGGFIDGLIAPVIDNLLQTMLPDPLGLEGTYDVGAMLAGVSPSTEAKLEMRMVPGGYVNLNNGGMSLGLITGINADEDPTTRTGDLDNEPAYCVPPFEAPDFAADPHNLPVQPLRGTFMLPPANEFNGSPNPTTDVAIGISETTLDLFGHHGVSSGALCMGIGTTTVAQLNLGTVGLLVPSLLDYASDQGSDPLLLVTRPQRPLDMVVGEGTDASPSLTIHIEDLEVDFYAFLYERYTRAFTMSLTLDVGINFEIEQLPGQAATLTPVLVGISSDNIALEVINSEFVKETPETLEAVLPTIFDLVLPLLANGLPAIALPEFAGFRMSDLSIQHVTTDEDDFLAIYASLEESPAMAAMLAKSGKHGQALVDQLHRNSATEWTLVSQPVASLRFVNTPAPTAVVAGLEAGDASQLPSVEVNAASFDELGRALEWSWRMAGGLWRPYTTATNDVLTIQDRAFAWQGKYDLELRARLVGSPQTSVSGASAVQAIIDSAAPTIELAQAAWDHDTFVVPAHDNVSGQHLAWAWGMPGATEPGTAWATSSALAKADAEALAVAGEITVFVRDEVGNVAIATARIAAAPADDGGGCQATNAGTGGLWLLVIGGLVLAGSRRKRLGLKTLWAARTNLTGAALLWLGASAVASMVPGCDCSNDPSGQACELPSDCAGFCDPNQVAFCIDNACVCADDVPAGRIGPYSDVGVSDGGKIWVSAYADTWGDLVLASPDEAGRILPTAWEWVDGVPDVAPEIPDATIRFGITERGDDVGMYTSVAVTPEGEPRVSYFDRTAGVLKFAAKVGDAWQIHVVDDGSGAGAGTAQAGVYTSMSLRSDDGRPGIAYTTYVTDGDTTTAQVWFAAAQTATPTAAADWTLFPVDSAVLPPVDEANPDPFPLPGGLGLFVDVARGPDQAPVVVYYDRTAGDLRMSRLDPLTGTFTAPQIIDGIDGDAGWSPSVIVGPDSVVHIAYVASTHEDLQYWNSTTATAEIIDDGYRLVGTTEDGLPKPEFHFIGDDVTVTLIDGNPAVVYQDATTHELVESRKGGDGLWTRETLAGNEATFAGAYGFYAAAAQSSDKLIISTWVLDLGNEDQWVEIFERSIGVD